MVVLPLIALNITSPKSSATIARIVGIYAGPVGWAITGAWTAVDLASPAYRVTVPACLLIAKLRAESQQNN
nr:ubiquinol-cytochrome C chaperone family protein [uncultured Campylobacter sp.]